LIDDRQIGFAISIEIPDREGDRTGSGWYLILGHERNGLREQEGARMEADKRG
jgi:hypothetical protein